MISKPRLFIIIVANESVVKIKVHELNIQCKALSIAKQSQYFLCQHKYYICFNLHTQLMDDTRTKSEKNVADHYAFCHMGKCVKKQLRQAAIFFSASLFSLG